MDESTRAQITSIIDDMDDLTLATVRPDGYPQATVVSYVNDGMTIYFGTGTDAQKAQNIAANNKVSLTITRPYPDWDHIEGISMGGLAHRVTDPAEMEKLASLFFSKFPQAAGYAPEAEEFGTMAFFRIDPEVISLLDYTKGFGHTELYEV